MHITKNLCELCGKPKIGYYGIYCPRCEKPQPETMTCYNLHKCMYYIEATGHPGFKKKFWDMLLELTDFTNDSIIELWNDPDETNPLLKELFEKMDIKDNTALFRISW